MDVTSLRYLSVSPVLVAVLLLSGCSTVSETTGIDIPRPEMSKTGEAAVTGAAIGGGLGLIVGSTAGMAGEGVVLGSLAGGAVGAGIGSSWERQEKEKARNKDAEIQETDLANQRATSSDERGDALDKTDNKISEDDLSLEPSVAKPQSSPAVSHAQPTHQESAAARKAAVPAAPAPNTARASLGSSGGVEGMNTESVHLLPFPTAEEFQVDEGLERAMELFEEVIVLGRLLRNDHNLKVRQPVAEVTIIFPRQDELAALRELDSYIKEELNVKRIIYSTDESKYVVLRARLNTKLLGKTLGPKLGRDGMRSLQQFVENLSSAQIKAIEQGEAVQYEDLQIGSEQVLIERTSAAASGGCVAASSGQITIVLDTKLTAELREEGIAREFVNRIQKLRKELGFEVTDRIMVHYMTACSRLPSAIGKHGAFIMEETLALEIQQVSSEQEMKSSGNVAKLPTAVEIEGKAVILKLTRLQS